MSGDAVNQYKLMSVSIYEREEQAADSNLAEEAVHTRCWVTANAAIENTLPERKYYHSFCIEASLEFKK